MDCDKILSNLRKILPHRFLCCNHQALAHSYKLLNDKVAFRIKIIRDCRLTNEMSVQQTTLSFISAHKKHLPLLLDVMTHNQTRVTYVHPISSFE
jgi:hypothetical protein